MQPNASKSYTILSNFTTIFQQYTKDAKAKQNFETQSDLSIEIKEREQSKGLDR